MLESEELDVSRTVIAEQQLLIAALKKSVHTMDRLDIYDTAYSQDINEMAYRWLSIHICRHFLNSNCCKTRAACERVHRVVSARVLMTQFQKVVDTKNVRASTFVNQMVQECARENWHSSRRVRDMLYELRQLI
jgi:hypothetical protein